MGALSDNYKKKSYTGSLSDKYFTNRGVDPNEIDKVNASISRRNILKGKVDSANAQAQVYQQEAGGVVNAVGNFADRVYNKIPTGLTYGNALKKVFVKAPVAAVQGAYKLVTSGTQKVVDARFQDTIDRANLKAIQDNTNSILLWRDIAKRDPSKADVAKNNIGQIMQQNTSLAEKTGGEIKNMTNKQMAGLALEVGIDLGTLGLGSVVTKGLIKGAKPAGSVAKFLINEIADNKATILATGSTLGAGYGAGTAMQENKNTQEILKSAGIGAAMGAGLVVAFPLALKLIGKTEDGIKLVKKLFNKEKLTAEEVDVAKALSDEIKDTSPIESKAIDDALEESEKVTKKTKPEDPLLQEARKYKSAEEFMNDHTPVFRSGTKIDISKVTDKGISTSRDRAVSERFMEVSNKAMDNYDRLGIPSYGATNGERNTLNEYFIPKNAKIATKNDIPEEVFSRYKEADPLIHPEDAEPIIGRWAKENGYDAVDFSTLGKTSAKEAEIKIFNLDVLKTKSQLTDLYNKAQGGKTEVREVPTTKTSSEQPQGKESGYAKSLEVKAVESKLSEAFGELSTYTPKTLKKEAEASIKVIDEGEEKVIRILRGQDELVGPLPQSFAKAVELHALNTKNGRLLEELGKSRFATIVSETGQGLSMLQGRNKYSPLNVINQIKKLRKEGIERASGKKADKVVGDTVKAIKQSIKKERVKTLSKKETWSSFVDAIKC